MFEDNQKKLSIILNRQVETAVLMNAIGHLAAGIMRKVEDDVFHDYPNDETGLCAYLSHYPVVILQAKNSNQLRTALEKCREAGLTYNFFTTTMLGQSTAQQIQDTKSSPAESLEFIAIALYGDTEALIPITKKFSVYK